MTVRERLLTRLSQPTDIAGINPALPMPLFALNAALGTETGFADASTGAQTVFTASNTTRVNCPAGVGYFPTNNATDTDIPRKSIDIDFTPISTHVLIWIDSYGSVASGTTNGWYYEPYESGTQRIRVFINSTGLGVQVFGTNIEGLAGGKLGLNSVFVRGEDSATGYDIWVNGVYTNIRGPAAGSFSPTVRESFIRQSGANGATAYILQAASWDADYFYTFGQALSEDPWLLWEPEQIYVPVVAGGGTPDGSAAFTLNGDTITAAGSTAVVTSAAITLAGDTLSAAATPIGDSSAAFTLAGDVIAASGDVGGTVNGTAAITLLGDTIAASANVGIVTSAGITLNGDTLAATAVTVVLATAAITLSGVGMTASGSSGSSSFTFPPCAIYLGGNIALGTNGQPIVLIFV